MSFIVPGGLGQDFAAVRTSAFDPAFMAVGLQLSNNNRTVTGIGTTNYGSVRGTLSQSSGKFYFEVTFNTQYSGSTGAGALAGIATNSFTMQNNYPGSDGNSYGVGSWFQANSEISGGIAKGNIGIPANGDVAMIAVDQTAPPNAAIWFGVNGAWFNGVGVSGIQDYVFRGAALYPIGFVQNNLVLTLNTGNVPFKFALPLGFSKWG